MIDEARQHIGYLEYQHADQRVRPGLAENRPERGDLVRPVDDRFELRHHATADAATLKRLSLKADVVVLDEAFRAIYSEDGLDFRDMKKLDLGALLKRIVEGSNVRFGTRIVEDAFIQELSYVTKDGVRTGGKRVT